MTSFPLMMAAGTGLTLTVWTAVAVQFLSDLAVTTYEVVCVGLTLIEASVTPILFQV